MTTLASKFKKLFGQRQPIMQNGPLMKSKTFLVLKLTLTFSKGDLPAWESELAFKGWIVNRLAILISFVSLFLWTIYDDDVADNYDDDENDGDDHEILPLDEDDDNYTRTLIYVGGVPWWPKLFPEPLALQLVGSTLSLLNITFHKSESFFILVYSLSYQFSYGLTGYKSVSI